MLNLMINLKYFPALEVEDTSLLQERKIHFLWNRKLLRRDVLLMQEMINMRQLLPGGAQQIINSHLGGLKGLKTVSKKDF